MSNAHVPESACKRPAPSSPPTASSGIGFLFHAGYFGSLLPRSIAHRRQPAAAYSSNSFTARGGSYRKLRTAFAGQGREIGCEALYSHAPSAGPSPLSYRAGQPRRGEDVRPMCQPLWLVRALDLGSRSAAICGLRYWASTWEVPISVGSQCSARSVNYQLVPLDQRTHGTLPNALAASVHLACTIQTKRAAQLSRLSVEQ